MRAREALFGQEQSMRSHTMATGDKKSGSTKPMNDPKRSGGSAQQGGGGSGQGKQSEQSGDEPRPQGSDFLEDPKPIPEVSNKTR
jgi:hypothetical protein